MGKTRPPERSKLAKKQKKQTADAKRKAAQAPSQLLAQAAIHLQQSDVESALQLATSALQQLKKTLKTEQDVFNCLPALSLLGEINVELGDIDAARDYFGQAAQIDEDGDLPEQAGGGADKFLWLAQLSEEGGKDSVMWFEKGAAVLRRQITAAIEEGMDQDTQALLLEEKKSKLSNALCAIAEVYMTDLSWDDKTAEEVCDRVVKEALEISPNNPEILQTVASVRISQLKVDEAKAYLQKSLDLWMDLPEDSPQVPDFPVRISLARLLMEAEMEEQALEVVERLIQEDDHSVEAWYLGGWCLHLLAEKQKPAANGASNGKAAVNTTEQQELQKRARRWLLRCLKIFETLEYEDEKLQEHAEELIASLNEVLGEPDENELDVDSGAEDEWEGIDTSDEESGSGDEEMEG
ncbi:hypothetical protein BT63DRAFT_299408 [Microthyrium microscopicum]|uniref:TPR domain-containing protein n=1 Tax=Microthyrium microscopicum TaxID=703497 RepID=A0A6A6U804_9PEZI|nr:hypothetical protein BT63DRAFT_299408 [Microthyrium microscopicum]